MLTMEKEGEEKLEGRKPREVHLQVGSGAAARSAGAYGGSEAGNIVGGIVGPPVIGGIVGGIVGEVVGADAISKIGLDEKAKRVNDKMGEVIGKRNAEKVSEITMTALGYSISETCICCPCLPASQIMLFVVLAFLCFNFYRLGYALGLNPSDVNATKINASVYEIKNNPDISSMELTSYLIVGASVWIAFLPFYLFTLFGNCWRQCCCCLCDPVVCCATITDFLKRCLCECGSFSCIGFIWYSMCVFQIAWTIYGVYATVLTFAFLNWNHHEEPIYLFGFAIASIVLDVYIAGSEIVHKFYHDKLTKEQKQIEIQKMPDNVDVVVTQPET